MVGVTPKDVWIYDLSRVYSYSMTLVIGLIADRGIVCAGDGRIKDGNDTVVSDTKLKIFELSSRCVLMPAGGMFEGITKNMAILYETLKGIGKENVTDIAALMATSYKNTSEASDPHQTMIFAGYDKSQDGTLEPRLYLVDSDDWKLRGPRYGTSYIPAGVAEEAITLLDREYEPMRYKTLDDVNRVALKAINHTIATNGDDVNGSVALWNIMSDGHIKKFSQQQIATILQDIE